MRIISRAYAKANGRKRYFTGKPCRKGHVGERLVSDKHCIMCAREATLRYVEKYPDRVKQTQRNAVAKKYNKYKEMSRNWAANNRDYINASARERRRVRQSPPEELKCVVCSSIFYTNNRQKRTCSESCSAELARRRTYRNNSKYRVAYRALKELGIQI